MLEVFLGQVTFHFSRGVFRRDAVALADLAEHELGEDIADTGGVMPSENQTALSLTAVPNV